MAKAIQPSTMTRRSAVTAIAVAAVLPASALAAPAGPDPIYAIIEHHGQKAAEFAAVLSRLGAFEEANRGRKYSDDPEYLALTQAEDTTSDAEIDAFDQVINAKPASTAAAMDWLSYVAAIDDNRLGVTATKDANGNEHLSYQIIFATLGGLLPGSQP